MIKGKQEVMWQTATPITMLWDRIMMLPIIGNLDSKRGQDIMEAALTKILDTQSKIMIMDILGVPIVDSAVANHLIKITKATQLMGCKCIITGLSPAIAQTMVHLGVDLGGITTRMTLRDGVEEAFSILGLEIIPFKKK